MIKLLQIYFSILSVILPKYAGKKAIILFQKVRKKDIRKRELPFYQSVERIHIPNTEKETIVYQLGNKQGKTVLLVHGWDSNAGSMSKFAERLVEEDYNVISIELPGHANYKSSTTNMYECKNMIKTVLNHIRPSEEISVISHSFGSSVVSYAFSEVDYKIDNLVFLTSPNIIISFFDDFKKMIHLGDKAYHHMCLLTNKIIKEDINTLSVQNKLKTVDYKKMLIIHDKLDKILPFSNAEEIAATDKRITIRPFERIGHYRMLWNKEVIDETLQFIKS